ncbi:MAG: hypothetical protein KAU35_06575, partial [candidate division Zixibacteria bacterium]|nr:hypothetical protein [candidate division Zixibacteria bacterium]
KPTPPDTTKYEIRIDLREPFRLEHMRKVEEFLNEPLRADGDSGFYRFRADKRLIRKLFGEKFGVELLEEVPGLQVPPPKQDSSDSSRPAPDSADIRGSFRRLPPLKKIDTPLTSSSSVSLPCASLRT